MKKAMLVTIFAVALALVTGTVVSAQAPAAPAAPPAAAPAAPAPAAAPAAPAEAPVAVKVTGTNVNVLATYGKGLDADPAGPLAKLNVLVVKEAVDAAGKPVDGMAGRTLYYVPVKAAADLAVGDANLGKTVVITGKVLVKGGAVIVEKFEAQAAKKVDAGWDTIGTKTMSQQAVI
jgi:2-oxoglutarate dehydrogenase E2 component (dihydrolipoamide succinyltransferase)